MPIVRDGATVIESSPLVALGKAMALITLMVKACCRVIGSFMNEVIPVW